MTNNLLRDGERSAWLNKTGFGNVTSYELDNDELTIRIKIDEQGKESLQNFSYEKGDRFGDLNIETYNIHREKWTMDKLKWMLTGNPIAEWATGKKGYKIYLNGLDAKKLYIPDLQSDLSASEFKTASEWLNFSLTQSSPIFKKIYELQHELFHMMNPHVPPSVEKNKGPEK